LVKFQQFHVPGMGEDKVTSSYDSVVMPPPPPPPPSVLETRNDEWAARACDRHFKGIASLMKDAWHVHVSSGGGG
jgi:hypothetical protein